MGNVYINLHAILSSLTSGIVAIHLAQVVSPPFVQRVHTVYTTHSLVTW